MGVIQSSINQAAQSIAVAPTLQKEIRERKVQEKYNQLYGSAYGEVLTKHPNLIKKQQEAMELMNQYREAAEFQRQSTKAYINKLGSQTTEGLKAEEKGQIRKQKMVEMFKKDLRDLSKGGK